MSSPEQWKPKQPIVHSGPSPEAPKAVPMTADQIEEALKEKKVVITNRYGGDKIATSVHTAGTVVVIEATGMDGSKSEPFTVDYKDKDNPEEGFEVILSDLEKD